MPDRAAPPHSAFALARVEPLFYTPLARFALPDAAALNALLMQEIAAIRRADPGYRRSNHGGWHSRDDLFRRTEPGIVRLTTLLRDAILQATLAIAPGAGFDGLGLECEGWINVNPAGAFNTPHDHPGWYWSGAYYVATPPAPDDDSAGCIEFLDGRTNLRVLSHIDADCMASKAVIRPAAGELLLFPSFLRHWVHPQNSGEERISIALNARFTRTRPG